MHKAYVKYNVIKTGSFMLPYFCYTCIYIANHNFKCLKDLILIPGLNIIIIHWTCTENSSDLQYNHSSIITYRKGIKPESPHNIQHQ